LEQILPADPQLVVETPDQWIVAIYKPMVVLSLDHRPETLNLVGISECQTFFCVVENQVVRIKLIVTNCKNGV
jgi:hypothetical protein